MISKTDIEDMTDMLREAAEYILDGMGIDGPDYTVDPDDEYLDAANSKWVKETLSRLAAALAAAPQPAPVMQYYYKDNTCPAEYGRAENCICWHNEGKGPFPDLKNGDAIPLAYGSAVGLTWRAAPQPAPVDREALVEFMKDAVNRHPPGKPYDVIADALLARGLRLPGNGARNRVEYDDAGMLDEVVTDAGIHLERMSDNGWFLSGQRSDGSEIAVWIKGKVVAVEERPAIRVVEGGDDAA